MLGRLGDSASPTTPAGRLAAVPASNGWAASAADCIAERVEAA